MNRELYPVERRVLEAVTAAAHILYQEGNTSGKDWTLALKRAIAAVAVKMRLRPYYCGEPDSFEWLWDMTWLDTDEDWQDFRGTFLACEIEWADERSAQSYDFLKLCVADAKYRVFICTPPEGKEDARLWHFADLSAHLQGKRYLAIAVPRREPKELPHLAWTT